MYLRQIVFALCFPLVWCHGAQAQSDVSGFVRNQAGRSLANINVVLVGANSPSGALLTDAWGRYVFPDIADGTYQLKFEDNNYLFYTDPDPYPDEGSVYLQYLTPENIVVQGQDTTAPDVVLTRVELADDRQALVSVTDCGNFGTIDQSGTFAYALEFGREISIECAGTMSVPEIVITKDTVIKAPSGLTLSALGVNRILRVHPGVSLDLDNVDITGGRFEYGSGLINFGYLTIHNSDITGNSGSNAAVLNTGFLTLQNVNHYLNTSSSSTAMLNRGVVSGTNVTIDRHNSSIGPVITNNGSINFQGCTLSGMSTNNVWAIENRIGSKIVLSNCDISNNLRSSLFMNKGTLEIDNSAIDNNAGDQGLIDNSGVLKIRSTSVTNNSVQSLIIYNTGLTDIVNSTISTNTAGVIVPPNDTITNPDDYRGVIGNTGLLRLINSTVAYNVHRGYEDRQLGNSGELRLSNSILAGTDSGLECGGSAAVTSDGYNLHSDGSCGDPLSTDIPYGNAALAVLAQNSGLTLVHALSEESDAIDQGNCDNGVIEKDQRGIPRPQGSACDIGAFEHQAEISQPVDAPVGNNPATNNNGSSQSADDMRAEVANSGGGAMSALVFLLLVTGFRRELQG